MVLSDPPVIYFTLMERVYCEVYLLLVIASLLRFAIVVIAMATDIDGVGAMMSLDLIQAPSRPPTAVEGPCVHPRSERHLVIPSSSY